MDRIEMSGKEIKRLEVLRGLADGVLSQREAGRVLGVSERQVRRLARRYGALGAAGLVSKHRGQPSNRRLDEAVKQTIVERVRDRYADFGPTLAAEYLRGEGLRVSKETLRGWMTEVGWWRPAQGRRQRLHPPRPRRPRWGELIQIDGSPHDWFEGRGARCTLLAFIDDATSRVMAARFVPVECTQAYLDALRIYVAAYGAPAALYSDRHGIFTKHDPEDGEPTQFQRAIRELGIAGIQALTPQAKGAVSDAPRPVGQSPTPGGYRRHRRGQCLLARISRRPQRPLRRHTGRSGGCPLALYRHGRSAGAYLRPPSPAHALEGPGAIVPPAALHPPDRGRPPLCPARAARDRRAIP